MMKSIGIILKEHSFWVICALILHSIVSIISYGKIRALLVVASSTMFITSPLFHYSIGDKMEIIAFALLVLSAILASIDYWRTFSNSSKTSQAQNNNHNNKHNHNKGHNR